MAAPLLAAARAAGIAIGRLDLPGAIVTCLDRAERVTAAGAIVVRRLARSGFARLGAGLVWRGAAAAAGIAVATALVSGLSSDQGQADAKNTTEEQALASAPAIRDVKREPWLPPGSDDWIAVNRPIAMFALAATDLEPTGYDARRSIDGSRREDVLSFGRLDQDRPHLRLRVAVGATGGDHAPLLVALARDAAGNGLSVRRSAAPLGLATRFGEIETADVKLEDGTTIRACLAFRRQQGSEGFGFGGWWCGSTEKPADRRQLACLIDRLDLVSAGAEPALRALFARSELSRPEHCTRHYLASTGRKSSWLDAEAKAPPLRLTPPPRPDHARVDRRRAKQNL